MQKIEAIRDRNDNGGMRQATQKPAGDNGGRAGVIWSSLARIYAVARRRDLIYVKTAGQSAARLMELGMLLCAQSTSRPSYIVQCAIRYLRPAAA